MIKIVFYILLSFIVFSSCSRELSPIAYVNYIESLDNGLNQEILAGNLKLTLQYKPNDYIIVQDLKQEQITREEYQKSLDDQGEGFIYLNLRISTINLNNQLNDPSNNDEMKSLLENELRDHIKLIINKIEYPCSIYYLETGMGVFPYSTVLIGFEVDEKSKGSLSLNLLQNQFINQTITFSVQKESINNIPALKLL